MSLLVTVPTLQRLKQKVCAHVVQTYAICTHRLTGKSRQLKWKSQVTKSLRRSFKTARPHTQCNDHLDNTLFCALSKNCYPTRICAKYQQLPVVLYIRSTAFLYHINDFPSILYRISLPLPTCVLLIVGRFPVVHPICCCPICICAPSYSFTRSLIPFVTEQLEIKRF